MKYHLKMMFLTLLLVISSISIVTSLSNNENETIEPKFISSGSLEFFDNESFESQGFPGNGTVDDPFIISGFSFNISSGQAIIMLGTDAHVVIRDNVFYGQDSADTAILFTNVRNLIIENNIISNFNNGTVSVNSLGNKIIGNTFHTGFQGIYLQTNTRNTTIENNKIFGFEFGIFLLNSRNNEISYNNIFGSYINVVIENSNDNIIHDNSLSLADAGFFLDRSLKNIIINNIFMQVQYPIFSEFSNHTKIISNDFDLSIYAISIHYGEQIEIRDNNFIHVNTVIDLQLVSNATVFNNIISYSGSGIIGSSSNNISIIHNKINYFSVGIYLFSNNTKIQSNTIFTTDSGPSVILTGYENEIIANTMFYPEDVEALAGFGGNTLISWNNIIHTKSSTLTKHQGTSDNETIVASYNYWSNLTGLTEIGSSGILDGSYTFDGNLTTDSNPLKDTYRVKNRPVVEDFLIDGKSEVSGVIDLKFSPMEVSFENHTITYEIQLLSYSCLICDVQNSTWEWMVELDTREFEDGEYALRIIGISEGGLVSVVDTERFTINNNPLIETVIQTETMTTTQPDTTDGDEETGIFDLSFSILPTIFGLFIGLIILQQKITKIRS
jgi:parallel beta-helix repeat protein